MASISNLRSILPDAELVFNISFNSTLILELVFPCSQRLYCKDFYQPSSILLPDAAKHNYLRLFSKAQQMQTAL